MNTYKRTPPFPQGALAKTPPIPTGWGGRGTMTMAGGGFGCRPVLDIYIYMYIIFTEGGI